jgi:heme exporter protein A
MLSLELSHIAKSFNRRNIFTDISFTLDQGLSLTVTGKNGSGKSTLMKIIAGILSPSKGSVEIVVNGNPAHKNDHFKYFGFVSPYLQLYDEFTGLENLELVQEIRGITTGHESFEHILQRVGLQGRGKDLLRTYSSGMKQRLKYAAAIIHTPKILLLDEPTANLDEDGKSIVRQIIRGQREQGIVIIATNEKEEVGWCDSMLELGTP